MCIYMHIQYIEYNNDIIVIIIHPTMAVAERPCRRGADWKCPTEHRI